MPPKKKRKKPTTIKGPLWKVWLWDKLGLGEKTTRPRIRAFAKRARKTLRRR